MNPLHRSCAAALPLLLACGLDHGRTCEETRQCRSPLACVTWSKTHEEIAGPCAGARCCMSPAYEPALAKLAQSVEEPKKARSQCNALVETSNATARKLATLEAPIVAAQILRPRADLMEALAASLEQLELDGDLAKLRDELMDAALLNAKAARDVAVALDAKNTAAADEKLKELESSSRAFGSLVDKLAGRCN